MNLICGDERFNIIKKARADLIFSTNISDSRDEMNLMDNFLFRCWQMGWLDKYKNEIMTNQQKFIEIFGQDVWIHMIVETGIAEQFKEYWTSPYKKEIEE